MAEPQTYAKAKKPVTKTTYLIPVHEVSRTGESTETEVEWRLPRDGSFRGTGSNC